MRSQPAPLWRAPRCGTCNGITVAKFEIRACEGQSVDKALLDRPITVTLGLIGPDGRIGLTPMWFDYEGDKVLVNTASHRSKCGWIRKNPSSRS